MEVMVTDTVMAEQMIEFLRPHVSSEEMRFLNSARFAGEHLAAVLDCCCLIREYQLPGAEDLLQAAYDQGLTSSWYAPFFKEFFMEQVA